MKLNKKIIILGITSIIVSVAVGCSSTNRDSNSNNKTQIDKEHSNSTYSLKYGELLDEIIDDELLIIKAKIEPSYKNSATIDQNGFNIEDIVKNQNGDKFKEIQYWAVADMENGEESKVISFTLKEELIQNIKDGNIVGNEIVEKSEDTWILPTLLNN